MVEDLDADVVALLAQRVAAGLPGGGNDDDLVFWYSFHCTYLAERARSKAGRGAQRLRTCWRT